MHAIRFHGRGGQGVVSAAELLSMAAFVEKSYAQAFPSFGSERTGAPVAAFCRIDARPIRLREPILAPDLVAVLDPTLLHVVDVFQGLSPDGWVIVNSSRPPEELGLETLALGPGRVRCVPATEIARRFVGRPLPGAAVLGALAGLTGIVKLASIQAALGERFPGEVGAKNAAAAAAAHELMQPLAEEIRC